MRQIQLDDQIYHDAERRAAEAGFGSVDEYVADVLQQEAVGEAQNFDHLFTPQRLAEIEHAAAEMDAGKFYTTEQADAELANRRAEWLRQNPS